MPSARADMEESLNANCKAGVERGKVEGSNPAWSTILNKPVEKLA
jgi:hypothetical protein